MSTTLRSLVVLALACSGCLAKGGLQLGGGGTGAGTGAGGGAPESSYGGPSGATGGPGAGDAVATEGEPRWDDYAFAVREREGTYYGPWTITKFTTFKVGKACWAKMADPKSDAVNNASYYVRNVHELAKTWTGDDWGSIEGQNSDRAKNRKLVEPMMDQFASRFHMTIEVEGDDCGVDREALWIRYWYGISEAFADYPPASGKLFITLKVTNTRDVTSEVDETGSHFTITAPRDIQAPEWSEKLERPFRRHARKL